MSLFDLSGVVALMATDTITVLRFATDTYTTAGIANARSSTSSTVRASVQPITGRDLARMPDGTNASELISVWAPMVFQLRDRITVSGRGSFEVQHVDLWGANGDQYVPR